MSEHAPASAVRIAPVSRSYRIEPHGLRSFEARGDGAIRCLAGRCWVTRAGDARDYLLRPGDVYLAAAGERLLVEALSAASVEITGAVVRRSSSGASRTGAGHTSAVHRVWAWFEATFPLRAATRS